MKFIYFVLLYLYCIDCFMLNYPQLSSIKIHHKYAKIENVFMCEKKYDKHIEYKGGFANHNVICKIVFVITLIYGTVSRNKRLKDNRNTTIH